MGPRTSYCPATTSPARKAGRKLYSAPQLEQKRLSGFTLFLQLGQKHLSAGTRGSASTRLSGSADGMSGICTRPPPSARRRVLLPRVPRVPRAAPPVTALAAVPDVASTRPGCGRRAPVTRPVRL